MLNMALIVYKYLLLSIISLSAAYDVFLNPTGTRLPDICYPAPPPPGGVEWILHVRQPNYGWGDHTHRANIALAVNKWRGTDEEMAKMDLQLEEDIINALMRNGDSKFHESDLALYIHALIATQKNPRNFHGVDLVADLLRRVESDTEVHPFLVLALCNSHAIQPAHLEKIKIYTEHRDINSTLKPREAEWKALALKAFACAGSLPDAKARNLDKYLKEMDAAVKCLTSKQVDGNFGNEYTTSLAVQALTATNDPRVLTNGKATWDEEAALDFLRNEYNTNINMYKAYYTELALNSRNVKFIKDLSNLPYPFVPESKDSTPLYWSTYTVQDQQDPDIYFSVRMKIPRGWNFFQIMEKAAKLNNRFNFSYMLNENDEPLVYEAIGKPNDAENNLFWTICRQNSLSNDSHSSTLSTHKSSPKKLIPLEREHIKLWYRTSDC